jgi:hypothetical protein
MDESTITNKELEKVLEDVNKIRLAIGIGEGNLPDLPRGVRRNPSQCVLARALSNGWEASIEDDISLTHHEPFKKPFNWDKAVDTLVNLGFNAYLYGDEDEDEFDEYPDYCEIHIERTNEMDTLISEFDEGLLPFLVLER